eukprot:gnl/TRDRNA2_/TRDRNA2_78951_c1_seq1.p1 gnl/TRDRNA2_/TRDRNA2_78951_c1~~gnl/TRDRNA2_/TRDRNA2_78951_c1_seq1.p1  ORF type:complete len:399 (-),score=42.81 gnl/TRDRNA2_/TRDRNA2_78951_c1_seq1:184-1305(-)
MVTEQLIESVKHVDQFQWRDLLIVAVVAGANTLLVSQLPLLSGKPMPLLMSSLFDKHMMTNEFTWSLESLGPFGTLLLCLLVKWITTLFAMSLPTPTGVVAPSMIIGALIGRCFILMVPEDWRDAMLITPDSMSVTDDTRGALIARFAIIGASAYTSAICRTFAMAITVFEVLALPNAVVPLACATLTGIFVANQVALPFFDCNLMARGLSGIVGLTSTDQSLEPVFKCMRRVNIQSDCLMGRATVQSIRTLLKISVDDDFPIVQCFDDGGDAILVGSVSRVSLLEILTKVGASGKDPDFTIDLLDPELKRPRSTGHPPLVKACPAHVEADTTMKDLFVVMKATTIDEPMFVTSEGCLVGVVHFSELCKGTNQ